MSNRGVVVLAAVATPLLLSYLLLAYALAVVLTLLVVPRVILARKLYWCCPFITHIFKAQGLLKGSCLKLGFETTYSINVLRRLLTLPIRPHVPDFYIVGFPKAGTTSLANCLKLHPAISGMDGLPWHEALSKESHFFNGVFGPNHASSATLYRSFFPTMLCRWWAEHIRGVKKWLCFDACPVTACLPYTARRMAAINPDAKLIFMFRDPIKSMFSAETMLVNMGMPLEWDLTKHPTFQGLHIQRHLLLIYTHVPWSMTNADLACNLLSWCHPPGLRFSPLATSIPYGGAIHSLMCLREQEDEAQLWKDLVDLQPGEPLPFNMPELFYTRLQLLLKCSQYADRIYPFLQQFSVHNMMFIDFQEFTQNTENVVREVCNFVGADPAMYNFKPLPAGMKTDYQKRTMHPDMKAFLSGHFQKSNYKLCCLLQQKFDWYDIEGA